MSLQDRVDNVISRTDERNLETLAHDVTTNQINSSYKVYTQLGKPSIAYLNRHLPNLHYITLSSKKSHTDHEILNAEREIIRQDVFNTYDPAKLPGLVLMVGAGSFEVATFSNCKNVWFNFSEVETKDFARLFKVVLEKRMERLYNSLRPNQQKILNSGDESLLVNNKKMKQYRSLKDYYEHGMTADDQRNERILVGDIRRLRTSLHFDYLYFCDSAYQFSSEDLATIMNNTGAKIAYGYGLYPLKLIFENIEDDEALSLKFDDKFVEIYYKEGSEPAYRHLKDNYKTILTKTVISADNNSYVIHHGKRFDHMLSFTIALSLSIGTEVRRLKLPENREVLKILNITKFAYSDGRIKEYFIVRKQIYNELLSYALNISDKSLTFANLMTYIRRTSYGFVINDHELKEKYTLPDEERINLALVVLVHATFVNLLAVPTVDKVVQYFSANDSNWSIFLENFKEYFKDVVTLGIRKLIKLFFVKNFVHEISSELVINLTNEIVIKETVKTKSTGFCLDSLSYLSRAKKTCYLDLKGVNLGEQLIECYNDIDPTYKFKTSRNDAIQLANSIRNNEDDVPVSMQDFLEEAANSVVVIDVDYEVKLFNIWGGPGTGKSFFAKMLALQDINETLIVGPFSALQAEYKNFDYEGHNYNFNYLTMHKALRTRTFKTLIFDEWTNIDYRLMAQIVNKVKPTKVFLVGDEKQTSLRPHEGTSPTYYLNNVKLNTHVLKKNFRNDKWVVHNLNELHGYGMICANQTYNPPRIGVLPDHLEENQKQIFFGKRTAERFEIFANVETVRRMQGCTFDNVYLMIGRDDLRLIENLSLLTVAISRHRYNLTLVLVDEDMEDRVREIFHLNEEINNNIRFEDTTYIETFWNENTEENVYINDFNNYEFLDSFTIVPYGIEFKEAIKKWNLEGQSICTLQSLWCLLNYVDWTPQKKTRFINWYRYKFKTQLSLFGVEIKQFDQVLQLLNLNIIFLKREKKSKDVSFLRIVKGERKIPGFLIETQDHIEFEEFITKSVTVKRNKTIKYITLTQSNIMDPISTIFPNFVNGHLPLCTLIGSDVNLDNEFVYGNYIENQYISDQEVKDLSETWVTRVPYDYLIEENQLLINDLVDVKQKSYDAYLLSSFFSPVFEEDPFTKYTNQLQSEILPNVRVNTINISADFLNPLNPRNNPRKLVFKGYKFSNGFGNSYFSNNHLQLLQCLMGRYANVKRNFECGPEGRELAKEIVRYSVDLIDKEKCFILPEEINKIFNDFTRKASEKSYIEKYYGEYLNNKKVINFSLKDIFKPFKEFKVKKEKIGQGISAWQSELNIIFNVTMRILSFVFKRSCKEKVLFNNGYDDRTVVKIFKEKLKNFPKDVDIAVIDATQFDSCQNVFTQNLERYFLLEIGATQEFLDAYYKFRNNYILKAMNVAMTKVESVKTSGEPATLLLNSVLELLILNYLVEGEGPKYLMVQGDDGIKYQANLKLNQQRYQNICRFCKLEIKLEINQLKEFCGYIVYKGELYLSLYRIFQKITGKHFRDYQHFSEYQISLRDKLNFISFLGVEKTIQANVAIYKSTINTFSTIYDIIRSWAHIDEKQFLDIMQWVEITFEPQPMYSQF